MSLGRSRAREHTHRLPLLRPAREHEREVSAVDLAGEVEVGGMVRGAPCGEQHAKICAINRRIAVQVTAR
jgi:hypothetical protein